MTGTDNTKRATLMLGKYEKKAVWGALAIFLLTSLHRCKTDDDNNFCRRSFYVWQTKFEPDSSTVSMLGRLNVDRLYVRYFDVAAGTNGPEPIAPMRWSAKFRTPQEIVPVVYITQSALAAATDLELLARQITLTVAAMHPDTLSEIQLDFDWTAHSRASYFALIRAVKSRGLRVSVTLRLHQIKYAESSDIPPADRVVLMAYHTSSPYRYSDENAILDVNELKKYLPSKTPYPLPVDVALPIFSWGVKFKGKRFVGIMPGIGVKDVEQNGMFEKSGRRTFIATRAGTFKGVRFDKNDALRVDEPDVATIAHACEILTQRIENFGGRVILYDWAPDRLQRIGPAECEKIFGSCVRQATAAATGASLKR